MDILHPHTIMAVFIPKEGESRGIPVPLIYGKPLDWHEARRERANTSIIPCDRVASVFRQQDGMIHREINAKATETQVYLSTDNNYIFFKANIIHTPEGLTLMEYDTQLLYPPEAGTLIEGTRYEGMPHFSELTPGVKAYFESLGHIIDGIHSVWEKPTTEVRSDNYTRYMQAKGKDKPHDPNLARSVTAAGKNAQNLGFTGEVYIQDSMNGRRGTIPCIVVDFYRPGISLSQFKKAS